MHRQCACILRSNGKLFFLLDDRRASHWFCLEVFPGNKPMAYLLSLTILFSGSSAFLPFFTVIWTWYFFSSHCWICLLFVSKSCCPIFEEKVSSFVRIGPSLKQIWCWDPFLVCCETWTLLPHTPPPTRYLLPKILSLLPGLSQASAFSFTDQQSFFKLGK